MGLWFEGQLPVLQQNMDPPTHGSHLFRAAVGRADLPTCPIV